MIAFTIFTIAIIIGIFFYEIILKRHNIVIFLSAVVSNVSSVLSAATLLTLLLEGFDVMFFRRTREERAKLKEERAELKKEKIQLEKLKAELSHEASKKQPSKPDKT